MRQHQSFTQANLLTYYAVDRSYRTWLEIDLQFYTDLEKAAEARSIQ